MNINHTVVCYYLALLSFVITPFTIVSRALTFTYVLEIVLPSASLPALILAIVVCPVPPFATPKVPVTPGVILAEPLNAAAAVLARLVCIFRPVCNVVAVEALPSRFALILDLLKFNAGYVVVGATLCPEAVYVAVLGVHVQS